MIRKLFYFLFPCLCAFSAQALSDPRTEIETVLAYWFGPLETLKIRLEERNKAWFNGGCEVDQEIQKHFGPLVEKALESKLDFWKKTPRGRLALILLLDQFPRNIYRGTSKAFAGDLQAQNLSLEALSLHEEEKLLPIERIFLYLPLEHAEDLELQKLSVAKFDDLAFLDPDLETYAHYAHLHYQDIQQFGRFPYRDAVLKRPIRSTGAIE